MAVIKLPAHLDRYRVDQDYSRYTPVDQAVWRHILKQLKSFLSVHAHPVYLDGLKKTGIEIDRIPSIESIDQHLQKFGWRAIPVSGFIPPAAFMELQAMEILPIASDMRTVDHMLYTPAPDLVHEAAGHAPILVDPSFAQYLKSYAKVARRAIVSKADLDQYEAIRVLSDLKEDPRSRRDDVERAEDHLAKVTASIQEPSEAALLGRMNWWTAEYGLIGDLKSPKIFGAGLLSSVGESRSCLNPQVKKIRLSLECIQYSYDITEPQPQLFVAEEFEHLESVLNELAATMAFMTGGLPALEKAQRSETVNTIELDSGIQISGRLVSVDEFQGEPSYLRFEGPTQVAFKGREIPGQGVGHHAVGFSCPLGHFTASSHSSPISIEHTAGKSIALRFHSGVLVEGDVEQVERLSAGALLIRFSRAKVTNGDRLLFDPSWGAFDMPVGHTVASVFGGPADRAAFGESDAFAKKVVPRKLHTPEEERQHAHYRALSAASDGDSLLRLYSDAKSSDWLFLSEFLRKTEDQGLGALSQRIRADLDSIAAGNPTYREHIRDALNTLHYR